MYTSGLGSLKWAQPNFCGIPTRNAGPDWHHEKISHGPMLRVILQNVGPVLSKPSKKKAAEEV